MADPSPVSPPRIYQAGIESAIVLSSCIDWNRHIKNRLRTANKNEFKKQSENLIHEAELVAAIAYVIRQEGFEYWDDEDYSNYCKMLETNALEVIRAVKLGDYRAARNAAGEISKVCSNCHEGYR